MVDQFFVLQVVDLAGADVAVKLRVGEAEIILVGLAAQPVGGYLVDRL